MNETRSPILRRDALEARRSMTQDERDRASLNIASRVIRSHEFAAARHIACYLPMRDEVDPARIIARAWRAGKQVYVPVMRPGYGMRFVRLEPDSRLVRNSYGIWEPETGLAILPRQLDLVVTPLVAFDARANRIGMGGGYYDRSFAFLGRRKSWRKPKLLGIAFACQEVPSIDASPWDVRLYAIVTESGWTIARRRQTINEA